MKSLLINGLLKQGSDSSAVQFAMLENMTIWNVAYQKISSIYTSQDEVSKMIEDERKTLVRNYRRKPAALEGMLLNSFCEHLSININKVNSTGDLNDLGQEIENRAIQLQKKISKNDFHGITTNDLVQYNMFKMFDNLSAEFKKKNKEEQQEIVKKIIDVIDEMPDEQKEILRKELKVDSVSQQAVNKAIATGTLGVAFVAVVEVAGFSAYIFAVQALAAIAGIIGFTLPFAAYTTLTSMMAALANPLLIIPATVGLGYFMTKRGNRTIRNNLIPTVVTQIVVSASKEGDTLRKSEQLVRRLKKLNSDSKEEDLYTKTKSWLSNIKLVKNK